MNRAIGYWCSQCSRVCCWECDRHDDSIEEIKTIGSRYCDDDACCDAEARAHGLPRERLDAIRLRRKAGANSCRHLQN